jgi:hypothetical protein
VADLNDILTNLRTEIVKAIIGINVRERGAGEASFVYQSPGLIKTEETAGRPRAFSVRLASIASKWCGVGLQRYDIGFEVKVGYPLNDWEIAMASDYDQMRIAINASAGRGSVTGVGYRVVNRDGFKVDKLEDWQFATFTIEGVVETEDTAATAGAVIIDTFTTGHDGSCHWTYYADYNGAHRVGKIFCAWDYSAGTISYTDDYDDYGTTTDLAMSCDMTAASGNVRLIATSTLYVWSVRVYETARNQGT